MHQELKSLIDQALLPNGDMDLERLLPAMDDCFNKLSASPKTGFHRDISNLIANLGEAAVIVDSNGLIEHFNRISQEMFGYTEPEIMGKNWELLTADGSFLDHIVKSQLPTVGEFFARRFGSEIFPAEVSLSPLQADDGLHYVAMIKDLSELKQAERELRDSETRFRDLAGSASDWFWETDEDHKLIFISQRIASVLGVNPSAIIGLTFEEQGLECDKDVYEHHQSDLAGRLPFRDRIFHAGPPEGVDSRTLRLSGMPVYDAHENFIGYRGVGVDITREVQAKKMATQVRQTLEDSIDSLDDGVVVFDSSGHMVTCNRAYLKILDVKDASDLVGMTFEQIQRTFENRFDTEGEDYESWLRARIERHKLALGIPFTVRLVDGRWLLVRECRMGDGGVVGVRTDITELKHREIEMEALKTRYQLILDSAGEGIIGLDTDGLVSFANKTAHNLLGYQDNKLIGKLFTPEIQPNYLNQQEIFLAYESGGATHMINQEFVRTDKSVMPVDYYAAPLRQGDLVEGTVVVFQDATLRRQYEAAMASAQEDLERLVTERTQELSKEVDIRARTEVALRESRARMKGITDCLLEAVLVVNGSGDVMFANPSARNLLNVQEPEEVEGLPLDHLFTLDGDAPIPFDQSPFKTVLTKQKPFKNDDASFITHDNRKLAVAYACSPMGGDGGNKAAVILFRDIRELKDAQWDAMQASRLASVGQLAAGIAHEINTPTQYIGDNLRFISDAFQSYQKIVNASSDWVEKTLQQTQDETAVAIKELIDAEDISYLSLEVPTAIDQSQQGVEQVRHIVLSMKEFSHPGSTSKVMTDLNRALESTLTVCRNTWKHVATADLEFDADLPHILCYPSELNQVFLNLIINATHAIEEAAIPDLGHIAISTKSDGQWVEVRVKDTGNGVPVAIRDRIFDPFFTTKPVGKGTGQGLAICRDVVVNKHGGRLDLDSTDGEGATFVVRLPVVLQEEAVIEEEEHE